MADPVALRVEGLAALRKAFASFGPDCRKFLRDELKTTSEFVRDVAVFEAHAQGLDDSGALIAGLKAGATGTTGYVRDTAKNPRDQFRYPARYEYESEGRRAFIRPAVEKSRPAIQARLTDAVKNAVERFNNRGGT